MVTKGETWWAGRDKSGAWEERTHTAVYKMDNQQGHTVQHGELYSIFCDNPYEKKNLKGMNICICITESLGYTPETNTTL